MHSMSWASCVILSGVRVLRPSLGRSLLPGVEPHLLVGTDLVFVLTF